MLKTIKNLPNRYNVFIHKNYAIYSLDDYYVHLSQEVQRALLKKGYIYIGMGGGITGDMQINDTDIHRPLKQNYRRHEQELMIEKLRDNPAKIPTGGRKDIMNLII